MKKIIWERVCFLDGFNPYLMAGLRNGVADTFHIRRHCSNMPVVFPNPEEEEEEEEASRSARGWGVSFESFRNIHLQGAGEGRAVMDKVVGVRI